MNIPSPQFSDLVQIGQSASVQLHGGITVAGKVSQIGSQAVNSTVPVTVQLQTAMGEFVGQEVDGTIGLKTLNDVIYVGRPAGPGTGADSTMFKMEPHGKYAIRVKVRFGASSASNLQILEGLHPGDRVILSDMAKYDGYDRVRLE